MLIALFGLTCLLISPFVYNRPHLPVTRQFFMIPELQFLERHSTPAVALVKPAPDDRQLKQILQSALYAPDHGRLHPYRFITIRDDARQKLSEVFGEAVKRRDPEVSDAYLKKQKDKPLRAPLIVVVVASLIESPKVPRIEQLLCAGSATHAILLASNAMGFGSIWLTGDNAYDDYVKQALGLDQNEEIIGFVYLGTQYKSLPRSPKPDIKTKISHWK